MDKFLPRIGSSFWNYAQQYKEFLKNHWGWIIGEGIKVSFWEDVWLFNKPLKDLLEVGLLKIKVSEAFEEKVFDYIHVI